MRRLGSILWLLGCCWAGYAIGGGQARAWEPGPQSPFAWWRFGAAYDPATERVYFLGGRSGGGVTDATVWSFNPVNESYAETGLHLAQPVSNHAVAVLDDGAGPAFYIFGERGADGKGVGEVQVYRPRNQSIEILGPDPFPGRVRFGEIPMGKAVAVIDNRAYVLGGFSPQARAASADTWVFDPTAEAGSRWSAGPRLSVPRAYIVTAVVDGKLYALGGDLVDPELGILQPTAVAERFDPLDAESGWSDAAVADLPLGCDESIAFGFDSSSSACRYAGQIVVAGCGRWYNEDGRVLLYDTATDSWREDSAGLEQSRRNHMAVRVPQLPGGFGKTAALLVFGGRQGDDQNLLDFTERLPLGPCEGISLALGANAASYQAGERLTLRLQIEGPGNRAADVYAALLLPDGELFGFAPDGSLVAGLPPALLENEPISSSELVLLDVDLPAGLPAGTYYAVAVAVAPGDELQNPGNWLEASLTSFEFQ